MVHFISHMVSWVCCQAGISVELLPVPNPASFPPIHRCCSQEDSIISILNTKLQLVPYSLSPILTGIIWSTLAITALMLNNKYRPPTPSLSGIWQQTFLADWSAGQLVSGGVVDPSWIQLGLALGHSSLSGLIHWSFVLEPGLKEQ